MDMLRPYFPITAKAKDVTSLVAAIVTYVVIGVIAGLIIGLLGQIPILGIAFRILGVLVEVYTLGGIVISVLDFLEIKF